MSKLSLSNSSDKVQIVTVEHNRAGGEVITASGSSTSDISSLNPNEGDNGLKRTLKSRHLTVNVEERKIYICDRLLLT